MKALLLTASTDGHSVKIMRLIASEMLCDNYDIIDIHTNPQIDWQAYDMVVIGASIRYGHYHKNLYAFIETHHEALNNMPSYFFGINLVARKMGKNTPETNIYTKKLLQKIKWTPKKAAVFAGACSWSKYNFWQTKIIQFIMIMTKGPTDTSTDIEFTDWDQVRSFAKSLV
ncbi:MAG: menaquinone-dependent protoporphyrinogen IX dehydrogenase [Alphaproteobacteria bacterium]